VLSTLRTYGGRAVWNGLRRVREHLGYPVSNACMESFRKQLGQRLKGPAMRWSTSNLNPMAALVSLWTQDQWDPWQAA